MKANRGVVTVMVGLAIGLFLFVYQPVAQTSLDVPAFSDPNLLAAIFIPSKADRTFAEPVLAPTSGLKEKRHEFHSDIRRPRIPADWETFDEQYAPASHPNQPTLRLMEKGMYEVNQTLYSLKLFERKVNSLLSLEWTMSELAGYDSRTKANELDNFFDHAKVKTEFDWEAPIGLYVGIRFQIKCYSIFQFWK